MPKFQAGFFSGDSNKITTPSSYKSACSYEAAFDKSAREVHKCMEMIQRLKSTFTIDGEKVGVDEAVGGAFGTNASNLYEISPDTPTPSLGLGTSPSSDDTEG